MDLEEELIKVRQELKESHERLVAKDLRCECFDVRCGQ